MRNEARDAVKWPTLLVVGLLALACSAHRMHRPVSLEERSDYSLAFIEFDDQGELWAPAQLDRALAHLERLNRDTVGMALVLFAHGWNSDASVREERPIDGTVYQYRAILTRIAESIRHDLPELDVPVVGIYLGWRGRVTSLPVLREASFYNRRGAAERIAGATATEVIYRILTTARQNPASRSVLIGHSFGSLILERALAQTVVSSLLAASGQELTFPADLVVLLNPAGSASQTKQLVDMLVRNRLKTYRFDQAGNRFERPLLVSFTSENDRATRLFFPAGMRIKAASKKFRAYGQAYCSPIANQRRLYTHTAGNLAALHSHEVGAGPKRVGNIAAPREGPAVMDLLRYEERYDPLTQQMAFSFDGERDRFTIKRKPRALNDTPYWIMRVPAELIPNHTSVLTEDTFRLIEAVLSLSRTYADDITTIVEREDGLRPVAIVPRPDGSALFLDRSRGVYAIGRESTRPVFVACLSETIDPSDAIGFGVAGSRAYAVVMTPQEGMAAGKCLTELYEIEVNDEGYQLRNRARFSGADCYAAATVDPRAERALLGIDGETGPQLWIADLDERAPRPRKLLDLPGSGAPTVLRFDASHRRLFAAEGAQGTLWEIDFDTEPPTPRRIDHDFGWPMALAYAPTDQRLYVTDAKTRTIWALDCRDQCRAPSVFLCSDAFESPNTLAVAFDGSLWLGDSQKQTLTLIAPTGQIERTTHSLAGAPTAPMQPVGRDDFGG